MSTAKALQVWGWLLAACIFVLVGCSILAVDAHNTLNEYKALHLQDITMLRKEIVDASFTRNDQLRMLINSNYEQLKQYVDIQVPMKARDAVSTMTSYSPVIVNQTANPNLQANPMVNIKP